MASFTESEANMFALILLFAAVGSFLGVRFALGVLDIVPQSNEDLVFI
jgi:hypothetical protein